LQLIREAHTSKFSGYVGEGKTMCQLHRCVYWPKIQEHVVRFIRECMICVLGTLAT